MTIVIPTRNRADWLARALQSALAQTYRPIDIAVIDDASTDETPAVVAGFRESEIHYWRHDRALGIMGNYQAGLEVASGDSVVFLSDDDALGPEFVAHRVDLLGRVPDAAVAFGGFEECDESLRVTRRLAPSLPVGAAIPAYQVFRASLARELTIASSLYRRQTILGLWPGLREAGKAFDTALNARIALAGHTAVFSGGCDVLWTRHSSQTSTGSDAYSEGMRMYESLASCTMPTPAFAACLRRFTSGWCVAWGFDLMARGDPKGARHQFRRAIAIDPSFRWAWKHGILSHLAAVGLAPGFRASVADED